MANIHAQQTWPSIPHLSPFKFSMDPLLSINQITMQMYSELTKENLNAINDCIQCHMEMINEMKNTKGLEGFISAQTYWTSKFSPKLYQYTQHILEILSRNAAQYNQCLTKDLQHVEQERKTKQQH